MINWCLMPTLAVFELYRGTSSKTLQRFFANSFYINFFIKNVKQTDKYLSGFIISTSLRIKKKNSHWFCNISLDLMNPSMLTWSQNDMEIIFIPVCDMCCWFHYLYLSKKFWELWLLMSLLSFTDPFMLTG